MDLSSVKGTNTSRVQLTTLRQKAEGIDTDINGRLSEIYACAKDARNIQIEPEAALSGQEIIENPILSIREIPNHSSLKLLPAEIRTEALAATQKINAWLQQMRDVGMRTQVRHKNLKTSIMKASGVSPVPFLETYHDSLRDFEEVLSGDAYVEMQIAMEELVLVMEENLSSVGDDAQLANIDLQNAMQKQQQTLQTMSNVSKLIHCTGMAIIRKIG